MKALKVRIKRGKLGQSMMVYPSGYNAQEVDRFGLGPLGVNHTGAYSGHIGRGGDEEWCIIALDDSLAFSYALHPDMTIITSDEADTLMEQWRLDNNESEDVITDAILITAIQAKQAARESLTKDERRALDPKDPMRGVNRRLRKMKDVLDGK